MSSFSSSSIINHLERKDLHLIVVDFSSNFTKVNLFALASRCCAYVHPLELESFLSYSLERTAGLVQRSIVNAERQEPIVLWFSSRQKLPKAMQLLKRGGFS
jgi:hypothetical protein